MGSEWENIKFKLEDDLSDDEHEKAREEVHSTLEDIDLEEIQYDRRPRYMGVGPSHGGWDVSLAGIGGNAATKETIRKVFEEYECVEGAGSVRVWEGVSGTATYFPNDDGSIGDTTEYDEDNDSYPSGDHGGSVAAGELEENHDIGVSPAAP